MPSNGHLSDGEKGLTLALDRHGFSLKDIAGNINLYPSTVVNFMDRHKPGVQKSLLKSAKQISDADMRAMQGVCAGKYSASKIKSDINLFIYVRRV